MKQEDLMIVDSKVPFLTAKRRIAMSLDTEGRDIPKNQMDDYEVTVRRGFAKEAERIGVADTCSRKIQKWAEGNRVDYWMDISNVAA